MELFLFILYFNIMLFFMQSNLIPNPTPSVQLPAFMTNSRSRPQVEYETWV